MTLYKLVQDICNLGKAQPNVNFVTQGDIYQLNHNQDVDYPAFVVTQGTHTGSDYDEEQFTLTLFAVDRLVSDKSNEIDVQSWANSVLLSVIKNIGDFYIGTVQSGFKIQTFTEKFDSLCAGAYVTLAINVDINDCDCVSKSIGFVTSVNGQTGDVTIKGYEGTLVSSVNGQTGDVYLNIPYKVSDLRNDVPYASESFVNNKITDVSTYVSNNYLKNGEVPVLDNYYTKQEVDDKIRDVSVDIDLSNYYTKQEVYDKIRDVSAEIDTLWEISDGFQIQLNETILNVDETQNILQGKQDTLVSGTNIKTINGLSLLGTGDIQIKLENNDYDHQNILYADYQELSETEKLKNIVYHITDYDIYFVNKSEYLQKITELEDRIKALETNLNN